MTSRTKLIFLLVLTLLTVTLMACPLSSTLMLTDDELYSVMRGEDWPEGK